VKVVVLLFSRCFGPRPRNKRKDSRTRGPWPRAHYHSYEKTTHGVCSRGPRAV